MKSKRPYTGPELVEYGAAVELTQNARTGSIWDADNQSHVESSERRDIGLTK